MSNASTIVLSLGFVALFPKELLVNKLLNHFYCFSKYFITFLCASLILIAIWWRK